MRLWLPLNLIKSNTKCGYRTCSNLLARKNYFNMSSNILDRNHNDNVNGKDSPPLKKTKLDIEVEKPAEKPIEKPIDNSNRNSNGESVEQEQSNGKAKKAGNEKDNKKGKKSLEKFQKIAKKNKLQSVSDGGPEQNTFMDVKSLLGEEVIENLIKNEECFNNKFEFGTEIELTISMLTSNGDGLGITPDNQWVIAVPFCLPGEKVLAKVHRNSYCHSYADLVNVLEKVGDDWRDESNIKCRYFGVCSGCQYQMIPYEKQLLLKKRVVEKAYKNFSKLDPTLVPKVLDTIPSPKQFNYRTKITPHFQAAPKSAGDDWQTKIGFDMKGRRSTIDIEECPIATPTLNEGMGPARQNVKDNIKSYKRGATLLLRDSMKRSETDPDAKAINVNPLDIQNLNEDDRICITNHKEIVREKVADKVFEFTAGSFFQNNSSILQPLSNYVLEALPQRHEVDGPMYLVDTYCGAGLFSITLCERFDKIAGIEISEQSINFAKRNVNLNGLDESKISFRVGRSEAIFDTVKDFEPLNTSVIIDPPRKGCDDAFLNQLMIFKPYRIVYVSCNVHTQARDVGKLCGPDGSYIIESLRGFDLFPQTSHVEGVAVLKLKQ